MRWGRLFASQVALFAALSGEAWAIPVTVTSVTYDDARRRLTLSVTGDVEIQTRQADRRIILEIPDARLRGGTFAQSPPSRRVRAILVSEVPGNPPAVRIELTLAPGLDPLLAVQHSGGKIYVVVGDPPPPQGERDQETLPRVPAGPIPPLEGRGSSGRRLLPPPQPSPTPPPVALFGTAPTPAPTPAAVIARPQARPTPALPVPTPGPTAQPPAARQGDRPPGTPSFALLGFQQAEVIERAQPLLLVGHPTGPAGIELQQWIWGILGLGLEARYLSWTARTSRRELPRQDTFALLRVGARAPLPYVEPEAYLAGAFRYQVNGWRDPPDLFAPALGAAIRIQPLEAIGLRAWGQHFPFGIGDDKIWRAGAQVLLGAGPVLLSAGYTHDGLVITGGSVEFDSASLGIGWQW